jgi:GH15 family glucan-1,4-alpha-glucosidase
MRTHNYKPIENYGVIGNLHTVALVGMDGSIDWCCLPHFDSPSIFGALLDARKGGYFKISVTHETTQKQMYLPESNILVTRFLSRDGVAEVMDFMPVEDRPEDDVNAHHLYRVVRSVHGAMHFRLECFPAVGYGKVQHEVHVHPHCVLFKAPGILFALHTPMRLKRSGTGVVADFILKEGEAATFVLRHIDKGGTEAVCGYPLLPQEAFTRTLNYWHNWSAQMEYTGRWRETVLRSALALKLLTFAPSGAIVAAATTSLPEYTGGTRNWDYRYTWLRDASFTIYAFLRLGFRHEAHQFMGWLQERMAHLNPNGSINVLYGLHGEPGHREEHLTHWEGYLHSKPVRVGNDAHDQLQLDIYGELMDSVYLYNKYGSPISHDLWVHLRKLLGYVCRHWQEKDKGIWETRSAAQHFVYSKVMCWVALDRGLRLAQKRSFPGDWPLWRKTRDAIYEDVMKNGWDAKNQTFVQHYGTTALDASTLVMPLVKFVSPTDPRMVSTLEHIKKRLVSDSLVRRYEHGKSVGGGKTGDEGTFSMCTFWYVEALARAGQVHEARWNFEKMLGYANHLGLYSEAVGPTGHLLGNYPQALTHLALISAAFNLDKALQIKERPEGDKTFVFFPAKQNVDRLHREEAAEKVPPIDGGRAETTNGHNREFSGVSPKSHRK